MNKLNEIQHRLLQQMQADLCSFLNEHQGLAFYCFAFDCNAEYAEILLCLNTDKDFQKSLNSYQSGSSKKYYQTDEDILCLRYNTGDWEYQDISSYTILEEIELSKLYGDNYDLIKSEIMTFNYQLLEQFCKTEAFEQIPKTQDFRVLCIDHDEDPDEAIKNTEKFVSWKL